VNPVAVVLVFARTLGLGLSAPVLAAPGLEPRYRLILAIALTTVLAPVIAPGLIVPNSVQEIIVSVLVEVLIGAAIGWTAGLIIAGARQAGEVVGAQAGLSAAALFDPEAGDELTPLGHLYGLVALGVFLALDGPLKLTRALIESYETLPVSELGLNIETADLAFARVGEALSLAVRGAAPVAIALTLAGVALGLIGRAAPSLPLATMSLPIRFVLGIGLAMLGTVVLAGTLNVAWGSWFASTLGAGGG
jgi:flagellar biosynthesis protein FliR